MNKPQIFLNMVLNGFKGFFTIYSQFHVLARVYVWSRQLKILLVFFSINK